MILYPETDPVYWLMSVFKLTQLVILYFCSVVQHQFSTLLILMQVSYIINFYKVCLFYYRCCWTRWKLFGRSQRQRHQKLWSGWEYYYLLPLFGISEVLGHSMVSLIKFMQFITLLYFNVCGIEIVWHIAKGNSPNCHIDKPLPPPQSPLYRVIIMININLWTLILLFSFS